MLKEITDQLVSQLFPMEISIIFLREAQEAYAAFQQCLSELAITGQPMSSSASSGVSDGKTITYQHTSKPKGFHPSQRRLLLSSR